MTNVRRVVYEKRHIVWPIAAALLLNVALLLLVVYPLSQKVAGGELQAQAASRELASAKQENTAARATVTGKGQADAELKKFYQDVLPPDRSGARRIAFKLDQLATSSNLQLLDSRSAAEVDDDSPLGKYNVTLQLRGEYTNIRRFIYEVERAPEFFVLENVSLVQGDSGARALNVTAVVATYYRTAGDGY